MTARLPNPGSDDGTWGDILNAFLLVSHNGDGTLQTSAITQAGGITTGQVGAAGGVASLNNSTQIPTSQLGSGTASNSNFLRGDGTWAVPGSGAVSSVFGRTGAVTAQSGDYTAAQVTGALTSSNNLSDVSSASTARTNLGLGTAATKDVDATASDIQPMGTQSAGSTGKVADAGHVHPTTGLLTVGGPLGLSVVSKTSAYTPTASDFLIECSAASGGFTVTLPGAPATGQMYMVKKTENSANVVTVSRSGSQLIDGNTTVSLQNQYEWAVVQFDGTNWAVVATNVYPVGARALNYFSAQRFNANGFPGSASQTRLMGANSSGAPTSGTFVTGDLATDYTGAIWVCTASGTPGTWVKLGQIDTTASDIQPLGTRAAGSTGKAADAGHVHPASFTATGYVAPAVVALTDGASIALDASQGNVFTVTLGGNRTLVNPTSPTNGQRITVEVTQDATGGRTLSFGTAYAFSTSLPQPVLSSTAGVTDYLQFMYVSTASQWHLVGALISDTSAVPISSGGTGATTAANARVNLQLGYLNTFGDGSDGTALLNGTNTFGWASLATNVYTMSRDVFCTSLTISSGVTLKPNGWRIFCTGSITNSGTVSSNGNNASGSTQGAGTGGGSLAGGRAGGPGTTTTGTNANGLTTVGTAGGGGAGSSGAGGNAGLTASNVSTACNSLFRTPAPVLNTVFSIFSTQAFVGTPGGGGGGGDGTNSGGGGGSGGGVVAILAPSVSNAGTISCVGGNGATPATGNCGGGGGGSGGLILIYTLSAWTAGTTAVTAGSAGNGVGTGSAGTSGSAGQVLNVILQ